MKIVLVRHGNTQGNAEQRYVGSLDQSVRTEGLEDLKRLFQKGIYPEVAVLYTSPMKRCLETAAIVYPNHKPIVVEELREICFGDFEGKTFEEIITIPGYEDFAAREDKMSFPGGEGLEVFKKRTYKAFLELVSACDKDFAIVTHGGVIMSIMSLLVGEDFYRLYVENGHGFILEIERTRGDENGKSDDFCVASYSRICS